MVPERDAADEVQRHALRGTSSSRAAAPLLPAGLANVAAGAHGRWPGRIAWPVSMPAHWESTAAVRGLYPWLVGRAQPIDGPVWGRDAISGALWSVDPWAGRRRGVVDDSGVLITGVIGSAKSSAAKSLAMRHTEFGRPFVVPGDIRGEWVPVVQAIDGRVLRLGPGMPDRLNVLAMPPRPPAVDEHTWWRMVLAHWHQLLISLVETLMPGGRDLEPEERTGLELALSTAAGNPDDHAGQARPISLHPVVELLLDPTAEMATHMRMPVGDMRDELRKVGLTLRELTSGPLAGLLDSSQPKNQIDPRAMATVVDLSRVQASDTALALVMSCTQAVLELAMSHRVQQWWQIYDELWRLMRFPALLRRLNAGQRTSRRSGRAWCSSRTACPTDSWAARRGGRRWPT
jgi:hypothetical protein